MSKSITNTARVVFTIYFVTVIYLCFGQIQSPENMPQIMLALPIDKCIHFLMFLPAPILSTYSFAKHNDFWKVLFWCVIASIASAFCLELLQSILTDYRQTDPWDLCANVSGIVTGSIIAVLFKKTILNILRN